MRRRQHVLLLRQDPIQDLRAEDSMLVLNVRGKRWRQQMCPTVFTLYPTTLPLGKGDEALSAVVIYFTQKRCPNLSQDTNHGDRLNGVCAKANTIKNIDQDFERGLEEDRVLRLNQSVVRIEGAKEHPDFRSDV